MLRLRLLALAALLILAFPLGGATGLACGDDCLDSSCGDCVQCQPCGVAVAPTALEAPRSAPRSIPAAPPVSTSTAPARAIEHVPLPA